MVNTHGFETVVEAGEDLLAKVLKGAWKSSECPIEAGDEGRIPKFLDIQSGTMFNSIYKAEDGQVQIPQDELDANFAPDVNGVDIKLGLHIQVEIKNPLLPSAGFWDFTADVHAETPIDKLPGSNNVGLKLDNLPRSNVTVQLTSGNPLTPRLNMLLIEFVQ